MEAGEGAKKGPSLFEEALLRIEAGLERELRPRLGSNLSKGLQILRHLDSLSRIAMEGLYSRVEIISLDDVDYARLKAKIRDLLVETENCLREQGVE
jgi:hypothetical protein